MRHAIVPGSFHVSVFLLLSSSLGNEPVHVLDKGPQRTDLVAAVRQAFFDSHDGWSTDEVLLQDVLNARFLQRCRELEPEAAPAQCNWTLLNLRKAGELGPVVTRRRRDRHDTYQHAAEIAARLMFDREQLTIDRVVCHPKHRETFDSIARQIAPDVPTYLMRKAAMGLRKARQLRPELVLRVADWGKTVHTISAEKILADATIVPAVPGIYIFRDRTGYLYIGQSKNLRTRVTKHLDRSDRQSLAHYLQTNRKSHDITVELHAFEPDSPARNQMVRRAYESELIRSRKPRFNIQP